MPALPRAEGGFMAKQAAPEDRFGVDATLKLTIEKHLLS
jgi:hypothetical protein